MRVEDVLLYVALARTIPDSRLAEVCAGAIAGGADAVQAPASSGAEALREAAAVCRRDDALLIVEADSELAGSVGAGGVLLDGTGESIGLARARMAEGLVGMLTHRPEQVALALEVGADFVLHASPQVLSDFAAFRREAAAPLFAAGIESLEAAADLVGSSVFRLGVVCASADERAATDFVAGFARLLGRCI